MTLTLLALLHLDVLQSLTANQLACCKAQCWPHALATSQQRIPADDTRAQM
jgi:hypothetical protein